MVVPTERKISFVPSGDDSKGTNAVTDEPRDRSSPAPSNAFDSSDFIYYVLGTVESAG